MNDLGAKMIRAEIMGNTSLAAELKAKLDAAKEMRLNSKNNPRKAEVVLLTITNASGTSKPIQPQDRKSDKNDRNAKKNKRVETHVKGERTSYYADDNNQRDIRSMVSCFSWKYLNPILVVNNFSLSAKNTLMVEKRKKNLLEQLAT